MDDEIYCTMLGRPASRFSSYNGGRPLSLYDNVPDSCGVRRFRPRAKTSERRRRYSLSVLHFRLSLVYQLQQEAPKPKRIVCQNYVVNKPPHYGRE